jgi:hypothetical protein
MQPAPDIFCVISRAFFIITFEIFPTFQLFPFDSFHISLSSCLSPMIFTKIINSEQKGSSLFFAHMNIPNKKRGTSNGE